MSSRPRVHQLEPAFAQHTTFSGAIMDRCDPPRGPRRQWPIVIAVIVAAALGGLGEYHLGYPDRPVPAQRPPRSAGPPPQEIVTTPPPGTGTPRVPESGTGSFVVAGEDGGHPIGTGGALVRFQIEVETVAQATSGEAPPVGPDRFAAAVEEALADPRSWAASQAWSFLRVTSAPDIVVRLATPRTTDERCGQYGLTTAGEVSCRGGTEIMINLKRWLLAVPWYADALPDYRRMVINHEMGHFLGFDDVACPGASQVAPVMQPQTYSLDGCVRNPWPYPTPDVDPVAHVPPSSRLTL